MTQRATVRPANYLFIPRNTLNGDGKTAVDQPAGFIRLPERNHGPQECVVLYPELDATGAMMPDIARERPTGRKMAGARGCGAATGMTTPISAKQLIAVVNSFHQFVPGPVHLKDLGQLWPARSRRPAASANGNYKTIAVDDGIRMGHAQLYSLPKTRADRRQRRIHVNDHCAERHGRHLHCDKITPHAGDGGDAQTSRSCFVSGVPMADGKVKLAKGTVKAAGPESTSWSPAAGGPRARKGRRQGLRENALPEMRLSDREGSPPIR